jgi:hypothetical protein
MFYFHIADIGEPYHPLKHSRAQEELYWDSLDWAASSPIILRLWPFFVQLSLSRYVNKKEIYWSLWRRVVSRLEPYLLNNDRMSACPVTDGSLVEKSQLLIFR